MIDKEYHAFLLRDINHIRNDPEVDSGEELRKHHEASARGRSLESAFSKLYEMVQFFYAAIDWFDVVRLACRLLSQYAEVRQHSPTALL